MNYQNKKDDSIGLWSKSNEHGDFWSPGKPQNIGGQNYWINMYPVESDNPKAPEFKLSIKPAQPRQG